MRDFLKETLIDPFVEGDWLGCILGGLFSILILIIAGLLLWLGIYLVDSSFLPLKQKEGVITDKYYVPAHTTTTYINTGGVMVPITSYHRESYVIRIGIDNSTDKVGINLGYWNQVSIGDRLCCEYTNGRILESLYIKSFCN